MLWMIVRRLIQFPFLLMVIFLVLRLACRPLPEAIVPLTDKTLAHLDKYFHRRR